MRPIAALLSAVLVLSIAGCSPGLKTIENDSADVITVATPTPDLPTPEPITEKPLIISQMKEKYTYDDMMADIAELQRRHSDIIQPVKICDTVDGRSVCDVIVGKQDGENQILIFGSMHAREYITTQVVMRQLCECVDILTGENSGEYNGISKKELLEDVTIHFIPMSNPDGVSISQFGMGGINTEVVRNLVSSIGGDYEQWKANGEGVDVNRNFDAGWAEYGGPNSPASDRYKGTAPGSSSEAAGLIKLTQDYKFKRTISYHTCGALIYWYYKQEGEVLEESRAFANRIADTTGYVPDSNYQAVDAAGYKDWAVYKMNIPSITIEVGNENGTGIINPVPISYFPSIWERNKDVVYATIYNMKYE